MLLDGTHVHGHRNGHKNNQEADLMLMLMLILILMLMLIPVLIPVLVRTFRELLLVRIRRFQTYACLRDWSAQVPRSNKTCRISKRPWDVHGRGFQKF